MLADYLEKIRTKTNVLVLKAVIYARYSSDMQRSESIAAQIRFIREFAKNNNIIINGDDVNHIINDGVTKALTGPIERNDITTVKKHLEILDDNDKEIYKKLSLEVVNVAEKKNKDRDYSKIKETLK